MAKPSVFVTRRWPAAVEAQLCDRYEVTLNRSDRPMGLFQFREALRRYDAVLPTDTDWLGKDALDVPQARTRIIANYGVGLSHICEPAAKRLGVTVTNTPDVVSECAADLAMTLLLMVARRAGEGERELRAGRWTGWRPTHLVGTKVSGKVLGIVGFGRIGREMAKRAHHGFGMTILVHDPHPQDPGALAQCGAEQVATLEDLLPRCDFVSLHCSGGAANRHLMNTPRLEMMKPGAYLVNTGAAELIDEHALIQALSFDTIGGAALDVFEGEPRIASDLLNCDNLVMLPHLASATKEAREAMGFRVLDNLDDFFGGKSPRDRVI
ncbi:Glycerate dehydrogenase [Marinibacterium anthonyi]|nr:Glycerate dehydrogenase [Marinibacterium anthonyi]